MKAAKHKIASLRTVKETQAETQLSVARQSLSEWNHPESALGFQHFPRASHDCAYCDRSRRLGRRHWEQLSRRRRHTALLFGKMSPCFSARKEKQQIRSESCRTLIAQRQWVEPLIGCHAWESCEETDQFPRCHFNDPAVNYG